MPDVLRNYNEHKSFVLALFKGRSLNPRDLKTDPEPYAFWQTFRVVTPLPTEDDGSGYLDLVASIKRITECPSPFQGLAATSLPFWSLAQQNFRELCSCGVLPLNLTRV